MGSLKKSSPREARPRQRTAVKSDSLVDTLRGWILSGKYPPGLRFPTHAALRRQFGFSVTTVQRAMDQLQQEGFLCSMSARGTFVSDKPPHLCRYGIVLQKTMNRASQSFQNFESILLMEAMRLRQRGTTDLCVYEGFESPDTIPAELESDIRVSRLAGLILTVPWIVAQSPLLPLLKGHRIPLVGIAEPGWLNAPGIPMVAPRHMALIERALDDFAARGRRHVAVLDILMQREEVLKAIKTRRLVTHPYWLQEVPESHRHAARSCMHLLMNGKDRPDALLIADDCLLEPATAGLVDGRARVPQNLDILSHCNFPYPSPSHLPVRRIGFDIRRVLSMCIEVIDACRRHERARAFSEVPVVLEHDVAG